MSLPGWDLSWRATIWSILAWQLNRKNETCWISYVTHLRIYAFAQCLQDDLSSSSTDDWIKSYHDSNSYLNTHCRIVRRVGKLLDVDMDDHDLSKSRIVQVALGFQWHWPSAREVNEQLSHMKKLALDAVHAGHLEVESHHPEHEAVGIGNVDVYKLFPDRLSVHLQKDVHDGQKGWGININFIPPQYRDEWSCFGRRYHTVDLKPPSKSSTKNICHNLSTFQLLNIFIR